MKLEQRRTIEAFAKAFGRTWKSKLREAWMTGNYPAGDYGDYGYLQQLRNSTDFGPSGLIKFQPGKGYTFSELEALAAEHGADVDTRIDSLHKTETVWVDLPTGKHWTANDTGMIGPHDSEKPSKASRSENYDFVVAEMLDGVCDCPHGQCDQCERSEDVADE